MLKIHVCSFIHSSVCPAVSLWSLQVEPEDVTVWQLWAVVPRGLHTVSDQAAAVWGQVRYRLSLQQPDNTLTTAAAST